MESRSYYMVRAMRSTQEDFDIFFSRNVVAVGWSGIDFTAYGTEELQRLLQQVKENYYSGQNTAAQVVGKKLNEVRRFLSIRKGDILLVPYYSAVRIAVSKGEYQYDPGCACQDLANQLQVEYLTAQDGLLTISRNELSEALQRRLRVRGSTVSDLYEFGQEIEGILSQDNFSFDAQFTKRMEQKEMQFKKTLLTNLRRGKTHLQTGGIGLEQLVRELFECEGYSARVCAKRETQGIGDKDIEAVKSDKFSEMKIIVQVKHHDGVSDDWGVRQLEAIQDSGEYENASYLFITSAVPSQAALQRAGRCGILVMDGAELVDWIYDCIGMLSSDTLHMLGISTLPQIME